MAQLLPNSDASVRVFRHGKEIIFSVKIGTLAEIARDELLPGVHVGPLNEEVREALGLEGRIDDGLLVVSVDRDSPYANRFQPNMVIAEINRLPVTDVETAKQLIVPQRRNLFLVIFHGNLRYLPVTVK